MPQDGPKIVPRALLAALGRSGTALGPLLAALGRSWLAPGPSWADLGASWGDLGGSWGDLGRPRGILPKGGRRHSRRAWPPLETFCESFCLQGLERPTILQRSSRESYNTPCCARGGGLKSASRDHRRHPLGSDRCESAFGFCEDRCG